MCININSLVHVLSTILFVLILFLSCSNSIYVLHSIIISWFTAVFIVHPEWCIKSSSPFLDIGNFHVVVNALKTKLQMGIKWNTNISGAQTKGVIFTHLEFHPYKIIFWYRSFNCIFCKRIWHFKKASKFYCSHMSVKGFNFSAYLVVVEVKSKIWQLKAQGLQLIVLIVIFAKNIICATEKIKSFFLTFAE